MAEVLRQSSQRLLDVRVASISSVILHSPERTKLGKSKTPGLDIFAQPTDHKVQLDGYTDDWSDLTQPAQHYEYSDNKSTEVVGSGTTLAKVVLRSAVSNSHLYLHFEIEDNALLFHDPNSGSFASGDRLELYFAAEEGFKRYVIRAIAPGTINAFVLVSEHEGEELYLPASSISSFLETTQSGYSIELSVPLPANGSGFGFSLIDVDEPGIADSDIWIGTVDPVEVRLQGRLRYQSKDLVKLMEPLTAMGTRLRVFDADGWLLADVNRLQEIPTDKGLVNPLTAGFTDALLYRVFNYLLRDHGPIENHSPYRLAGSHRLVTSGVDLQVDGDVKSGRYQIAQGVVIGNLSALIDGNTSHGFLLNEVADESINVVISSTLVRLSGVLFFLIIAVIAGLFFYASWLSIRIRKISNATTLALHNDGRLSTNIPGIAAKDEIGDLSRNISDLLQRLSSYTAYLQTLASKLSHELRTPLAVVSTSLESISVQTLSIQDKLFIQRAQKGAKRLQGLIRSLSEANNLEQALQSAEFETLDFVSWLAEITHMYQDIYKQRIIEFNNQAGNDSVIMNVSPELMQLMLDKLVSNAVDFSPHGGRIELGLMNGEDGVCLTVFNQGKQLPKSIKEQLFEPMVSQRNIKDDNPHLGMGLYIVRLIAEIHCAQFAAENRSDGEGVVFRILFRP